MFFNLIGALGLFLLGMWMMTEGLKLAGGRALENLLANWTSTRLRGLLSGTFITALVQSSSAVTVATLGFVNAGLLTFRRALWVVFGSNVGTTFTAWIVTFFGFNMKLEALTFPLIGLGAMMRIFYPSERGKSLGMALAGFGLLFMGIDELKGSFSGYADSLNLNELLGDPQNQTLLALILGLVLTVLTQSSSASIALILTAVASGIGTIYLAAAAVIGANVGTTSTALIAGFGATRNAKRLAWAHVIFNLMTGAIAFSLLPVFWFLVESIAHYSHLEGNPIMLVAIFHTCFNLLGVLLMWPIEPKLASWLLSLYHRDEDLDSEKPFLDINISNIPDVAIRGMRKELKYLVKIVSHWSFSLSHHKVTSKDISRVQKRIVSLNQFIEQSFKSELAQHHGQSLSYGLSVSHHLNYASKTYKEFLHRFDDLDKLSPASHQQVEAWFKIVNGYCRDLLNLKQQQVSEQLLLLKRSYNDTKSQLLAGESEPDFNIQSLDAALQAASFTRRFCELLTEAVEAFRALKNSSNARQDDND